MHTFSLVKNALSLFIDRHFRLQKKIIKYFVNENMIVEFNKTNTLFFVVLKFSAFMFYL